MKQQDDKFVQQVTNTLDDGTRRLDAETLSRLYDSRRQAMSAVHSHHVGQGVLALKRHPALLGLGIAVLLLTAAWLGLRQPQPYRPAPSDTSELDIQLLTGKVPPQVFADWSLVTKEHVEAVCLTDS
jgi:hypothetical protein